MRGRRIAVLGAGNGGQTLCADLLLRGHEARLYEHPDFASGLEGIEKRGGIELTGAIEGFARLPIATTNIATALDGADVVCIVVPSFAQMAMMERALPHLEEGMTVVFIPGNFVSLEVRNFLRGKDVFRRICLAETDTLPYACRIIESARVHVWGIKEEIAISALPGVETEALVEDLEGLFPLRLRPAKNVLEIGFSNMNMLVHCTTVLLNAGRIESTGGDFRFYSDGVTPTVGRLQDLMDEERMRIGEALGLGLVGAVDWVKATYPVRGKNMYEVMANNPIYAGHGSDAPREVRHRYITEDVPNLLVPVRDFGAAAGVATPIIDSIITLASALTECDYAEKGRNLARLGLNGMAVEDIRRMVEFPFSRI